MGFATTTTTAWANWMPVEYATAPAPFMIADARPFHPPIAIAMVRKMMPLGFAEAIAQPTPMAMAFVMMSTTAWAKWMNAAFATDLVLRGTAAVMTSLMATAIAMATSWMPLASVEALAQPTWMKMAFAMMWTPVWVRLLLLPCLLRMDSFVQAAT